MRVCISLLQNRIKLRQDAPHCSIFPARTEKSTDWRGGPGREVEIDECLLHRRKSNWGREKPRGWVAGGIEHPKSANENPRLLLEFCPDRSKETLQRLIHKWVLSGTLILTDSFTSYRGLEDSGEYRHRTVNHSQEFVTSDLANTQGIVGIWHWIRVHGLSRYVSLKYHREK